jgi:FixJ family two-component response regulator
MSVDTPSIFIIDDEEAVRTGLARLVRAIGMHSITFESAESFLETCNPSHAGCLLVDMRMPGMSGIDLLEELGRRNIPMAAILMTGHADARAIERLETLAVVGCLEKPFRLADLKEMLARWWSRLDRGDPPWASKTPRT